MMSCLLMLLALGKSSLSATIKIQENTKDKTLQISNYNHPFSNQFLDLEQEDESNYSPKPKLAKALNSWHFFTANKNSFLRISARAKSRFESHINLSYLCFYRI